MRWGARIGIAVACLALGLAAPAAAKTKTKTFHGCVTGAVPLPDRSSAALSINVPAPKGAKGLGSIKSIRMGTRITHTADGDLAIAYVTPDARAFALSTSNGGSGDGYGSGGATGCPSSSLVFFDQGAALPISSPGNVGNNPILGSFQPQASFIHVDHSRVFGLWVLVVSDTATDDVGTLQAFSLDITYSYTTVKKKGKKK